MTEWVRLMARYNQWMNDRLYAVCAEMTDEERRRDRGTFFGSMHGILNHILLADRAWLGRFTGVPYPGIRSLDQELYADFAELVAERAATDAQILTWADALTPEALAGPLRYRTLSDPQERVNPLWIAVSHFFNHQTHHRGQLATLIFQAGHDTGVTDIMRMPEVMGPERP